VSTRSCTPAERLADYAVFRHDEAERACRVLDKLRYFGLKEFHLTGGVALQLHHLAAAGWAAPRTLNDLDIVVPAFAAVPDTLASGFLLRHIHPRATPGNIVVQLVDAPEKLRIDLFSPYGATMSRSSSYRRFHIPVVSAEDLAARIASLLMGLDEGNPVARKYAGDFQWLADFVDREKVEMAWQDHRRVTDPPNFVVARERIFELIKSHSHLLIVPQYSSDVNAVCPRCETIGAWKLASGRTIMSILGYV
jgi:hypothetical protein